MTALIAGAVALIFVWSIVLDFIHKGDWANPFRLFALATCILVAIFGMGLP